jgi:ribosome-associated toxin RatA of RatAB toxin-antitoxin module
VPSIRRKAEVEWTPEQMYALVNDVEAYPEFLNWCTGARVITECDGQLTAQLDVGFGGISHSFSTVNTLEPPHRITVSLRNGPFRSLEGEWTFTETQTGCTISLNLEFTVSPGPLGLVLSGAFEHIVRSQMDAFVQRARNTYG